MHVSERSELACFSNTCGYLGTRTMTTLLGYAGHQSARRQNQCIGRSNVLAEDHELGLSGFSVAKG